MAANDNPYLALLQQEAKPPGWAQILQHIGNLGFGLAGGFGQAAATGQPTMAAIGPGLMMGNQMNAQAAHQAEQERMKRLELQFKAQEHEDKRAERLRKENELKAYLNMPGFQVAPQQGPLMGPQPQGPTTGSPPQGGGYDTRVAGLEGGTKKGGMVFNELGSGAFGPYQFMPATWAAVRAQNPSLNLPADITQASREQHDAAHNAFKAGNAQGLQAAGFQPTPENLYLAHRFGLGGATSVLRADPDKPLAEVLPIDWQRQNPDMRGQTAGGFRRLATERVGGSSVPYVVRPDAKPVQYGGPVIEQGDSPDSQPPAALTPVMPQPTWEKPGDLVPVNPAGWFPPPAAPAPGQPPPVPGQPPTAPGTPTPGGPNVVQAQYQPQPGQPTMAPGGGPAPGGANPPPEFSPPARVPVPAEVAAHYKRLAAAGLISVPQAEKAIEDYGENLNKQVHETARAQHQGRVEIWKQREQVAVEQRKIQAQVEAEQRAIAEAKRKHELSREEEGDWVRGDDGIERFVPKKDITPGMTRRDKPAAPPAPGTPAGDDHILSTAPKDSVEYRDAYRRQEREPKIINGQAYVRDMTKVPPPTYGQPAGAPAPSAGPPAAPAAPASKPSDVPGMKPVGTPQLNNEQARDAGFADRMQNSNRLLSTFDTQGASAWQRLSEKVPGGGYAQSPEYQQFKQARDDFINAQLRRESGSAIGVEEYEKADRQYFPQPGDKPEVIKQKALNRQLALEGMVRGAGPSYQPSQSVPAPGDDTAPQASTGGAPAPGFVKNGYRFKGGDPSQRMNWEPVK